MMYIQRKTENVNLAFFKYALTKITVVVHACALHHTYLLLHNMLMISS